MAKRKRELADFEGWYIQHETENGGMLVSEAVDSPKPERFWLPAAKVEITHEYAKVRGRRRIDFTIPMALAEEKEMV